MILAFNHVERLSDSQKCDGGERILGGRSGQRQRAGGGQADGRCAGRCDQRLKRVGSGVIAVGDARLRGGNGRSVGAQNRVRRER